MLSFYASYIPSLVGANQYKNPEIDISIERYKYFKKNGIIIDDEIDNMMKIENEYREKFKNKLTKREISMLIVNSSKLDNAEYRKEIIEKLSKTTYGNANESKVIKKLFKDYNIEVTENNSEVFSIELENFFIKGKIDGFTYVNGEKVLVEIKSRVNSIKNDIPFYEVIQVIILMKLTNTKSCILVQNKNKEINIRTIMFDEELYNNIISILENVAILIKEIDNEKFKKGLKQLKFIK